MMPLRQDRRGVTTVEFALVAPVFFLALLGLLDIAHLAYANAVLNGAVQEAARTSSLETANTVAADNKVKGSIQKVMPSAVFASTRKSYFDFADVGRAERWNDANASGDCDDNESYTDENRNGNWDEDIGVAGNGGANDVVIYTVKINYHSPFAVPLLPAGMSDHELTASAVKKNQPYAFQGNYGSSAGICD